MPASLSSKYSECPSWPATTQKLSNLSGPMPEPWSSTQLSRARGITDPAVLTAMLEIPRHRFLPGVELAAAYADAAQPTAEGQTISQPYMVAVMTEELEVHAGQHVLEIGTGSGYQTAILARLGATVLSIESSPRLAAQAKSILDELGYGPQVRVIIGDGTLGYPPEAPYDRILVTAGAPRLPSAYRDQLAVGGRIAIPIGDRTEQRMTIFIGQGDQWLRQEVGGCRFVPLIGAGWLARLTTLTIFYLIAMMGIWRASDCRQARDQGGAGCIRVIGRTGIPRGSRAGPPHRSPLPSG